MTTVSVRQVNATHIGQFEVAQETEWLSSALWDCFGGRIFNMAANSSPKNSPTNHLAPVSRATSEWRMDKGTK